MSKELQGGAEGNILTKYDSESERVSSKKKNLRRFSGRNTPNIIFLKKLDLVCGFDQIV